MNNYLLAPYAIAQFATAAVSIVVTVMMWKHRSARSGWYLFMLFVAISEWALANGLEAAAVPQELKIFWSKVAYLGIQTSPVFLMFFALSYTGRVHRIKPMVFALLLVIPVLIILLAATNEMHGLIWASFSAGPEDMNSLIYHHGPAFWIGVANIITMVTFATTFLVVSAVRSQKVYRFQHLIIILASILPWVGMIMYLLNLSPFPGLDTTAIGFLFTGILLMIGISRGKMMNYIPIAHELLFKSIEDGIIVLDEDLRIMDMNRGAEDQLSMNFNDMVGKCLTEVLKVPETILEYFDKDENRRFEMHSPFGNQNWLNIGISPLRNNRQNFFGWVMFFENISQRKETERKLQQSNQKLERQLNEIRALEDQLREAANCDSLTGVFNRGYLKETLIREISRAERKHYAMSVIMIDVDEFKSVNDTYGHKTGDDVLVALGRMLQSSTREADCVSRFGGDEFVLVMPEMSKEHAFQRAETWRKKCKVLKIGSSDATIHFTISIGVAVFPVDGETNESLLSAADQALYEAKRSGRDCTRLAMNN